MAYFDLVRVVIRLFAMLTFAKAAWFAASDIASAMFWVPQMLQTPGFYDHVTWRLAGELIYVLALLATGATFWFASDYIARRVVGASERVPAPLVIDPQTLFAVGCSLIGLWLIVGGVMTASNLVFRGVLDLPAAYWEGGESSVGQVTVALIQFVLGFFLLLDSRGLAGCVMRLRTAAIASPPAAVEDHSPDSD